MEYSGIQKYVQPSAAASVRGRTAADASFAYVSSVRLKCHVKLLSEVACAQDVFLWVVEEGNKQHVHVLIQQFD